MRYQSDAERGRRLKGRTVLGFCVGDPGSRVVGWWPPREPEGVLPHDFGYTCLSETSPLLLRPIASDGGRWRDLC